MTTFYDNKWKVCKIKDFGVVITGATPATKNKNYYGEGYKLISPADLTESKYITSSHKKITAEGLSTVRSVPKNAILVGCIGNIGKIGITLDEVSAFNQQINAVVCNKDFNHNFIYYLLLYSRPLLENKAAKVTLPILNKSNFENIELHVPNSLGGQEAIASVLSSLQDVIGLQEELVQKYKELKQSMMHHLFTYGTKGEQTKITEIGEMPESWKDLELKHIVNFTTGKLNSNAMEEDGIYPFFTCSKENYKINTFAFDCEAMLLSGNNASAVYTVKYYNGKFNAYQRTYIITLKDADKNRYSYFRYNLENNLLKLKSLSIGSSTKYLTLGLLNQLKVAVPSSAEEQERIGKTIDLINERISSAETKVVAYKKLFATLLHEFMSGERSV